MCAIEFVKLAVQILGLLLPLHNLALFRILILHHMVLTIPSTHYQDHSTYTSNISHCTIAPISKTTTYIPNAGTLETSQINQ